MNEVCRIAADLSRAVSFVLGRKAPKTSQHLDALKRLSSIFVKEVRNEMDNYVLPAQTSSSPTTKKAVRETP